MTETRFTDFEVAVMAGAELGEGPRWDAATGTLLWVDIPGQTVHRYDPATSEDAVRPVPGIVSLALPRRRGGAVIGLPDGRPLLRRNHSRSASFIGPMNCQYTGDCRRLSTRRL